MPDHCLSKYCSVYLTHTVKFWLFLGKLAFRPCCIICIVNNPLKYVSEFLSVAGGGVVLWVYVLNDRNPVWEESHVGGIPLGGIPYGRNLVGRNPVWEESCGRNPVGRSPMLEEYRVGGIPWEESCGEEFHDHHPTKRTIFAIYLLSTYLELQFLNKHSFHSSPIIIFHRT